MQWTLRDGNIISALNGMCLSVAPEPEYDKLMNKPFIIGHRGFVAKYHKCFIVIEPLLC